MYILDFVFNENTGESQITVDFFDESMTNMEINLAIMDGEIREDVTKKVGEIFGTDIENQVRNGNINLVCLDDHPEEKDTKIRKDILIENSQTDSQNQRKENIV